MKKIITQGPLDAVDHLSYTLVIPGQVVRITWTAPFTLDLTNSDVDITYCIHASLNGHMQIFEGIMQDKIL